MYRKIIEEACDVLTEMHRLEKTLSVRTEEGSPTAYTLVRRNAALRVATSAVAYWVWQRDQRLHALVTQYRKALVVWGRQGCWHRLSTRKPRHPRVSRKEEWGVACEEGRLWYTHARALIDEAQHTQESEVLVGAERWTFLCVYTHRWTRLVQAAEEHLKTKELQHGTEDTE